MRAFLAGAALAGLAGCLGPSPTHPVALESPAFRPENFFAGRTQGRGTLELRTGARRAFEVEGQGRVQPDGSLQLEQVVKFADGAVERRTWVLTRLDARTYAATLSDAEGPVSAEAVGNRLHLHYLMRKPVVRAKQWLYLQPDGRTALNIGTVTVLGIPWARLTEEIRKAD